MTHLSLSIAALRELVARGELSATSVCESFLTRIDAQEQLGAMTDVTACAALAAAAAVDLAVQRGEFVGALAGIPIAVKSNIDTAAAVCSAGLPHLRDHRPRVDAPVVARLRRAGAVIVGTAATDSGGFGVTSPGVANPRFPQRVTGGSSGGSAAAVAAGLCKAALGTDTGGSVRIPAACCAVIGFKPTFGRVSTDGVRPLASSVDHVGVLAQTVDDVRAVMEVADPGHAALDALDAAPRARFGIARTYLADAAPDVAMAVGAWADRCAALGHAVVEVDLPRPEDILGSHLVLSLTEAALHHLDHAPEPLEALPLTARDSIRLGLGYTGYEHLRAQRLRLDFLRHMQAVFAQVDIVALPTLPLVPPERGSVTVRVGNRDVSLLEALIRYTAPFDQSGHPALAVPWRERGHGPVTSIQLIGPLHGDRRLLALAALLERDIPGFGHTAID